MKCVSCYIEHIVVSIFDTYPHPEQHKQSPGTPFCPNCGKPEMVSAVGPGVEAVERNPIQYLIGDGR